MGDLSRLSEKLRTTFSRLILEWGTGARYTVSLPLTFRISSTNMDKKVSRYLVGQTHDISENGIGILSEVISADSLHVHFSNDMIRKNLLEIELELPEEKIQFVGETCRYQKLERSQFNYLLGIRITKISSQNKLIWQKYLRKLKRSNFSNQKVSF